LLVVSSLLESGRPYCSVRRRTGGINLPTRVALQLPLHFAASQELRGRGHRRPDAQRRTDTAQRIGWIERATVLE
jgi:hypothetical protein